MKSCSYCGAQYPDAVTTCPVDGQSLGEADAAKPDHGGTSTPKVRCPACGAADNYAATVELRGSFSILAFLAGGILAVIFRNAGRPKKVRCNKCDVIFDIHPPLSKMSRVIFWLLIGPTILALVLLLLGLLGAIHFH